MASARPAPAIGSERIERDELHSPYNPHHQMRGAGKTRSCGNGKGTCCAGICRVGRGRERVSTAGLLSGFSFPFPVSQLSNLSVRRKKEGGEKKVRKKQYIFQFIVQIGLVD